MIGESLLLGAVVTVLVQWLKNKFETNKAGTLFMVALLSITFAIGAWLLQAFNLMEVFLAILASATTIYAFIVQHVEDLG